MRTLPLLLIAAVAVPAVAREATVYQPLKGAFSHGYKEKIEKDGTWRVSASGMRGDQLSIAMYRAAELAHAEGHAYVELADAFGRSGPGGSSATLRARGSDVPTASAACAARGKHCYVADVAELMRRLSGPYGDQPGVPVVDHVDDLGREVTVTGFGLAAAGRAAPTVAFVPAPAPMRAAAVSRPDHASGIAPTVPFVAFDAQQAAAERRAAAMAEIAPVRGRHPTQGWTISD